MGWAQLGKWKVAFAVLECHSCSWLTFGKASFQPLLRPACSPHWESCSWCLVSLMVPAATPKTPGQNEAMVEENTQELVAPSQNIIIPWQPPGPHLMGTSGCGSKRMQKGPPARANPRQLQSPAETVLYMGAWEQCVRVILFDITRLALQMEELCEHISNIFMELKVNIRKLLNRQNCALNRQQIKVISFNKITKNSRSVKSVWSYIYSE